MLKIDTQTKTGCDQIKRNIFIYMVIALIATMSFGISNLDTIAAGSATYNPDNTISTYSQCACGVQGDYLYHKATFKNYCPICHRTGSLTYTHNEGSVEGRLTCGDGYANGGCDGDFCAVCGKEEIIGTHYWLTKATYNPETPVPIEQTPYKAPSKVDFIKLKLKEPIVAGNV